MKIEVIGNKEQMKPALEKFCIELEQEFQRTKETWDKRLKRASKINILGGGFTPEIPEMAFAVLDTDEPNKLIFFHSAATNILHRILKIPIKRMEKMIEGYLRTQDVDAKAKWIE